MPHVSIAAPPAAAYYSVSSTPQTSFTIPFAFFALTDIKVSTVAGGVETPLVYSSSPTTSAQYSVTGTTADGGYSGGTVTIGGSGVSDCNVSVYRKLVPGRDSDFPYPSAFIDPLAINTELDRVVAIQVDHDARLGRCIQVTIADESAGDVAFVLPPIEERKNKAIVFDGTGLVIKASASDPDATVSLASAAAASAAQALAEASAAKDAAVSAQAAAESAGVTSTVEFTITLVEGTYQYLLPGRAASPQVVHLYWDGNRLIPGTDYTIGDSLGAGMTLVLLVNGVNVGGSAVTSDGSGGTHPAGTVYWGTVSGGIVDAAIGSKSIKEVNIDDLAVSTRTIASQAVTTAKIADNAVTEDHIAAYALPFSKITTGALAVGRVLVVGASGSPGSIAQNSKYRKLQDNGVGSFPTWSGSIVNVGYATPSTGTEVTWTLPSDMGSIDAFDLLLAGGLEMSGSDFLYVQLGTGSSGSPSWVTSGYTGRGTINNVEHFPAFSNGFTIGRYLNNGPLFGSVQFRRMSSNIWHMTFTGERTLSGVGLIVASGRVSLPSALTQFRLLSGGASTFVSGEVAALVTI